MCTLYIRYWYNDAQDRLSKILNEIQVFLLEKTGHFFFFFLRDIPYFMEIEKDVGNKSA